MSSSVQQGYFAESMLNAAFNKAAARPLYSRLTGTADASPFAKDRVARKTCFIAVCSAGRGAGTPLPDQGSHLSPAARGQSSLVAESSRRVLSQVEPHDSPTLLAVRERSEYAGSYRHLRAATGEEIGARRRLSAAFGSLRTQFAPRSQSAYLLRPTTVETGRWTRQVYWVRASP